MKRTNTSTTAGKTMAGVVMVLALAAGCSRLDTGSGDSKIIGKDGVPCPAVAEPGSDFCLTGSVEQVENDNGCPSFTCVPSDCPVYQKPECPAGQHVEIEVDDKGCNVPQCVPTNCPIDQIPQCPQGQHVESTIEADGCKTFQCVPDVDVCPQVAAPPADFCPDGETIEQYVTDAGCKDFRCVPVNCPVYQIPQCPQGQHVELVVGTDGCKAPVCVADADPCPTIAAPDATFCPKGQVLLDATQCNWVCHGGDRCPFIGDFAECQGTTVIESDPATHCLTGIDCLP